MGKVMEFKIMTSPVQSLASIVRLTKKKTKNKVKMERWSTKVTRCNSMKSRSLKWSTSFSTRVVI